MDTYENYPVGEAYLLTAQGERVGPAMLNSSDERTYVVTSGVVKDVTDYTGRDTSDGLELTDDSGSTLLLSNLTLADASTIFPNTPRKFTSVASLSASIEKEIMKSHSYTPTTESTEDTISITVDKSGNVLELVRTDSEGELYFREAGEWVQVGENDEAPTIFDQSIIDIDLEDADRAIEYYDENVNSADSIPKEDMLEFAALVQ